jgi:DNA-binding LacI/PurR family transcriptional regulator
LLAAGAMDALKAEGMSVPEDISITGFDDFSFGAELDPPLTTVHVPLKDMGTLAVAKLVEIIKGEQSPVNKILVSTKLIVRNSTGAAAG